MSEPIPEAVPTSSKPRRGAGGGPPAKRAKLTPTTQQSAQVEALFANPDREIQIPDGTSQRPRGLAPPPEIVANVQGSSAGAGSGEFHVYKASRRREHERLRLMDQEVEEEKAEQEFQRKKEEMRERDEERLSKNRAKRDKAKARKMKAKGGKAEGGGGKEGFSNEAGGAGGDVKSKKRLGGAVQLPKKEGEDGDKNGEDGGANGQEEEADEDAGVVIHDDD